MLLKGSGPEERSKRSSALGLAATGTTTTVSNSNGKSFRNGKLGAPSDCDSL